MRRNILQRKNVSSVLVFPYRAKVLTIVWRASQMLQSSACRMPCLDSRYACYETAVQWSLRQWALRRMARKTTAESPDVQDPEVSFADAGGLKEDISQDLIRETRTVIDQQFFPSAVVNKAPVPLNTGASERGGRGKKTRADILQEACVQWPHLIRRLRGFVFGCLGKTRNSTFTFRNSSNHCFCWGVPSG